MTWYSVQNRYWIFVKGYGFLSYAKNMGKNISKDIIKNLSGRYSKERFDYTKQTISYRCT